MVVLGGSAAAPELLARSRVQLIDDQDPESKQPYHAVEFLCVEEATGRLDGYMAVATRLAHDAIRTQSEQLQGRGILVRSVGIIDSSSRKLVSLPAILASHALIHAADGDHFQKRAVCCSGTMSAAGLPDPGPNAGSLRRRAPSPSRWENTRDRG